MKKIRINTDTKEKLVNGAFTKIKQTLKEYLDDKDIDENFNPNYCIRVYAKNDFDHSFILRISRGIDPKHDFHVNYFVHLCFGFEEDGEQALNTIDIIKYNKYGDQTYLWHQILEILDISLFMDCNDAVIEIYNEKNYGTIKYILTEDDPGLSSIDAFIDDVVMRTLDDYITESNPSLYIYSLNMNYETELNQLLMMKIVSM